MVKNSSTLNNKGFSLIELMVVVAIIGILAAIGIPQYSKFQAKARQSEAKVGLGALFTAEASFFAEWSKYSVNLKNIGFGVTGTSLRYVTGFNPVACANYGAIVNGAPAEVPDNTNTWSDESAIAVGANAATFAFLPAPGTRTLAGTVPSCDSTTAGQVFVAAAMGDPNTNITATPLDGWTINQAKSLSNSTPGIK